MSNLTSAVSQLHRMWRDGGLVEEGTERLFVVLPLLHIYSMVANMLFGLSIGAEMVLHQRFDAAAVVDEIAHRKISVFFGVPTMFVAIGTLELPDAGRLASLKFCNSGGAPIALESYRRFVDKARCRLLEGWA